MTQTGLFGLKYGIDNECFTLGGNFDPDRFRRALHRIGEVHGTDACFFAVAPDVVGDARATLKQFDVWAHIIRDIGFPVALAAQDGLEDLEIPWDGFEALFVGGSTEWKLSEAAAELMRKAKRRGKWTHMGRVNSTHRSSRLREFPDSVDGTAWAKHPAKYAVQWQRWLDGGMAKFVDVLL